MNLDDELRRMFRDPRMDLAPAPSAERDIVAGARRRRRNRRSLAVGGGVLVAVLGVVGGVTASGFGVDHLPPAVSTSVTKQPLPTVLGPNTFGRLRLGMPLQQAQETGMVGDAVDRLPEGGSAACTARALVDSAGVDYGTVIFSPRSGLVEILPKNSPRTPEGLRTGMPMEQAVGIYPGLDAAWPERSSGIGSTPVPGHSKAVYQVGYANAKVSWIGLVLSDSECG